MQRKRWTSGCRESSTASSEGALMTASTNRPVRSVECLPVIFLIRSYTGHWHCSGIPPFRPHSPDFQAKRGCVATELRNGRRSRNKLFPFLPKPSPQLPPPTLPSPRTEGAACARSDASPRDVKRCEPHDSLAYCPRAEGDVACIPTRVRLGGRWRPGFLRSHQNAAP